MLEAGLQKMRSGSREMQGMSANMKKLCGRIETVRQGLKTGSSDALLRKGLKSQEEQLEFLADAMKNAAQVLAECADLYERYDDQIAEHPLPTDGGWIERKIDLHPVREMAGNLGEFRF